MVIHSSVDCRASLAMTRGNGVPRIVDVECRALLVMTWMVTFNKKKPAMRCGLGMGRL